ISRIVKTLVLAVFHKSFTSSASVWESILIDLNDLSFGLHKRP
ncbi:hypothetical protein Tco_1032752, partial [Tanacetum coccineum]